METDHRKGLIYAIITATFWGFMAIVLKVVTYELPPVTVVWFRFLTAFLVLGLWTLLFRRKDFRIFARPPWMLFLAALFLGGNYMGFIAGIKYVSPSASQIFIQFAPVGFALSGILIFREHVNWRHLIGFALVLAGIGLFYSEQLADLAEKGTGEHFTLGMFLVLGGGLSWAVFATFQKMLVKKVRPNQLNLFIYGFWALMLIPLVRFAKLEGMPPTYWILLVYLGLNTVIAYGSLALAIKYTHATRVSVIITLNPVLTFVSMALLTRMEVTWIEPEAFSFLSFLGAVTVLSGAITVIMAGRRRKNSGYPSSSSRFFRLNRREVKSMNPPKSIMKTPDQRLML